ncbi:glycosyl transferase [Bacteroidia bacterium]|nr:glycosyl transferase [Bacteroidia bacterium]
MIKICFVISSLVNEGPVNVMYNIIQYMDFKVFEVSVVTLIPERTNSRMDDFRQLPISIHSLTEQKHLNPLQMFRGLKKTVRELNPHILHAHCPRSLYLTSFLPRQYKRVYTIHIYPGFQQIIKYGRLKGSVVVRLNNYFTRKMDLPIGCAESIGDLYKQHKGWDIMTISNGSSMPVWKEDMEQKQRLREWFHLKDGVRYFIFIGRFSKEKNPDVLVEAFKKLHHPEAGLIMLGDGPLWEKLKGEATDQLILPGFTTDVYSYLIASDYYISTSEVEGLANTLLESMAVGLPLLLSDIPSHREVMEKMTKTTGYILRPDDVIDIVDKMQLMLQLPNTEEVPAEVQRVFTAYYTAEKMSKAYQSAYISLLKT